MVVPLFASGAQQPIPSNRFSIEILSKRDNKWREVLVYQSTNPNNKENDVSWCSFPAEGSLNVRIKSLQEEVNTVIIRPGKFQIPHQLLRGTLNVTFDKPHKLSIEINGDQHHPLLLFAYSPEKIPKTKHGETLVIFKSGVQEIGERYPLKSNTIYYLEEGAYLRGSLYGKGALENVTIKGQGIIDSRDQKWQHPTKGLLSNIAFEDGRNITIEGITCLEAGNFQLKIQSKAENTRITIKDVKLIGWNNNTDGIHVSDMDWKDNVKIGNAANTRLLVDDSFIRANDDAVLLCDGVSKSEMKNCVIWDNGYGASFCISWGGHNKVESCLVKNCYVIHKEAKNPVFRALHAGEAQIRNIRFENITIEGDAYTLVGLKITHHKYDPDAGLGSIRNILFKNVSLEGITTDNYIEGFDSGHQIENITFDNLNINGKPILNASDMNLRTNEFVQDVRFVK